MSLTLTPVDREAAAAATSGKARDSWLWNLTGREYAAKLPRPAAGVLSETVVDYLLDHDAQEILGASPPAYRKASREQAMYALESALEELTIVVSGELLLSVS